MKKIDLKISLKKILHTFSDIGSDADKDWKIMLIIAIISFLSIIVVNANTFISVERQKMVGASAQGKKTEFIDTKALMKVLSEYDARARDYASVASSTRSLVDPSR